MANLFELPRYIAVEGPIRVGKSTLAGVLAERLNAQRVTKAKITLSCGGFYDGEPGRFSGAIRFFDPSLRAAARPRPGAPFAKTVITDFIFEKDKLFACLNLTDQELGTYNRYYNYFREQLPTPDLVIYLQATPEVLKKRLKKKNAAGEKAINEDYLEEVVKAYEHFFFHYTSSDLLIVNTSEIDFVERNEDLQELSARSPRPSRARNISCRWAARKPPARRPQGATAAPGCPVELDCHLKAEVCETRPAMPPLSVFWRLARPAWRPHRDAHYQ